MTLPKQDEMDWTRGKNERREITENIRDKETRRLQKTRKTTAKMGDCVKTDLRKAEEEEKWREKANNREQWKK